MSTSSDGAVYIGFTRSVAEKCRIDGEGEKEEREHLLKPRGWS